MGPVETQDLKPSRYLSCTTARRYFQIRLRSLPFVAVVSKSAICPLAHWQRLTGAWTLTPCSYCVCR